MTERFSLDDDRPLMGFIGRFAYQKGADLLIEAIEQSLRNKLEFNVVILGSGDKSLEESTRALSKSYKGRVGAEIAYNEGLARHIYAGCDFLVMPSRFEPCGLNQLYAMRYGTIPIASHVGGLKDTVADIGNIKEGQGIVIDSLTKEGLLNAIQRAIKLYQNKKVYSKLRNNISQLDYSWSNSAKVYTALYSSFLN